MWSCICAFTCSWSSRGLPGSESTQYGENWGGEPEPESDAGGDIITNSCFISTSSGSATGSEIERETTDHSVIWAHFQTCLSFALFGFRNACQTILASIPWFACVHTGSTCSVASGKLITLQSSSVGDSRPPSLTNFDLHPNAIAVCAYAQTNLTRGRNTYCSSGWPSSGPSSPVVVCGWPVADTWCSQWPSSALLTYASVKKNMKADIYKGHEWHRWIPFHI